MIEVQDGQQSYQLEGRAAAMVVFIVRKAAMMKARGKMRLEFHCKGNTVRPRLEFYEDEDIIRIP